MEYNGICDWGSGRNIPRCSTNTVAHPDFIDYSIRRFAEGSLVESLGIVSVGA